MTFTEIPFWVLTALVFLLWLRCRTSYRVTVALLLVSSICFYGYHRWRLVPLVLAYCLVDWAVACWLVRSRRPRWVLSVGVGFNLVLLGYWKYTPLLLRTFLPAAASDWPLADWTIPFGISFYAFTGIAYLVDVYRRVTPVETNLFRYTLSALFFPHLVAGPILRPGDFLEKLRPETMPVAPEAPLEAMQLLARGFFKKMVLADRLALAVDPFFLHIADSSTAGVWSLPYVWLYAFQIYFDFSGYTDIARGVGLLFGFRWPENFNLPYLAGSIQDFWRRWHITLSLFLKDYLYIPLGGNRGPRWRTHLNLMLTMLLGGLWHGASWSFLLWGGLHGLFLVVSRLWSGSRIGLRLQAATGMVGWFWRGVSVALTFQCVCLAWCFFRLTDLQASVMCVQKWLVFDADKLLAGGSADRSLWLLLGVYAVFAWLGNRYGPRLAATATRPVLAPFSRGFAWGFGVTLLLLAVLLAPGGEAPPFIYFQF
jgi:D-alanyl-lipoteichoic acid acyltransferase DltB (MBOAT superfamily)